MSMLHICCNYPRTTVFRDLFTHLHEAGVREHVYVPEKEAAMIGKYSAVDFSLG